MASPAVLVVDDNEVNRIVLRCMLDGLGLPPQEAADGGQAVRLSISTPFDLILMDCMMPVLDGLEATRQLRREGRCRFAWVVAVTANTLVHDRERCLAAGMNDYIAKPFTLDILLRALRRWSEVCRPAWSPPGTGPNLVLEDPETDFTGLRQLGTLAGPSAVVEVVGIFLGEGDALLLRLQEAGEDPIRLHGIAHRIKGASASVGLAHVQRLAAGLEARAKMGDGDGAAGMRPALVQALRDGFLALRRLLASEFSGGDPRP